MFSRTRHAKERATCGERLAAACQCRNTRVCCVFCMCIDRANQLTHLNVRVCFQTTIFSVLASERCTAGWLCEVGTINVQGMSYSCRCRTCKVLLSRAALDARMTKPSHNLDAVQTTLRLDTICFSLFALHPPQNMECTAACASKSVLLVSSTLAKISAAANRAAKK